MKIIETDEIWIQFDVVAWIEAENGRSSMGSCTKWNPFLAAGGACLSVLRAKLGENNAGETHLEAAIFLQTEITTEKSCLPEPLWRPWIDFTNGQIKIQGPGYRKQGAPSVHKLLLPFVCFDLTILSEILPLATKSLEMASGLNGSLHRGLRLLELLEGWRG